MKTFSKFRVASSASSDILRCQAQAKRAAFRIPKDGYFSGVSRVVSCLACPPFVASTFKLPR